jgi:hypothetical protein
MKLDELKRPHSHITTEPLVTVYDLRDIEQAFRDLVDRKPGLFKAVLQIG